MMTVVENIELLRDRVAQTQQEFLRDVQYLAKRSKEDDVDFMDKDSWGRWDSWNDWGAAS